MTYKSLIAFCLSAFVIAFVVEDAAAQASSRSQKEQSHFGAEVAIKKAAEIPTDVLSILRQDKRNQTCLKPGESPANITSLWFVGSRIHLDGDHEADLVVTARNECLLGANLVPFWVFRNTPQGNQLVLSVSALTLDVLNTKTNKSRNIRTAAATAREVYTVVFKFDGKEYRSQKLKSTQGTSFLE